MAYILNVRYHSRLTQASLFRFTHLCYCLYHDLEMLMQVDSK